MRKLVILCHLSLDGIAAIPSGDLSWISYDADLERYAEPIVAATDTAMYGPVTYEMMKYWRTVQSDPNTSQHEREHAAWIEDVEKIVVSHSERETDWNNTRVIHDNIGEEIRKMKEMPGKNITVFGSPRLANSLIRLGLVDEYYLTISPVIIGSGTRLFDDITDTVRLNLIEQQTFASGAMALHYAKMI